MRKEQKNKNYLSKKKKKEKRKEEQLNQRASRSMSYNSTDTSFSHDNWLRG